MIRLFWATLLAAFPCYASFSVSPLRIEFDASEPRTETVMVRNTGDDPVTVDIYTRNFLQQSNGNEAESEGQLHNRGLLEWLSVSPRGLTTLQPGENQEIRLTLDAPADGEGLYWAKLYVHEASTPQPIDTVKGETTMRLFIKKRWEVRIHAEYPNSERSGDIVDFSYHQAGDDHPAYFVVDVANLGTSFLRCQGRLEIRNDDGETVREINLDDDGSFPIYPGVRRRLAAALESPLPAGQYIALAIVDYGGENLVAGEMEFEVEAEVSDAPVLPTPDLAALIPALSVVDDWLSHTTQRVYPHFAPLKGTITPAPARVICGQSVPCELSASDDGHSRPGVSA